MHTVQIKPKLVPGPEGTQDNYELNPAAEYCVEASLTLRRRLTVPRTGRTGKEWAGFLLANLLIMPAAVLVYAHVCSTGLKAIADVFATKVYKLPVPGVGRLAEFDGWDRLDIAYPAALGLFVCLLYVWSWVIKHLYSFGDAPYERVVLTVGFYFQAVLFGSLILVELLIFYLGLDIVDSSFRGDNTSVFAGLAAPIVTFIYAILMASLALWHSKFYYGVSDEILNEM